MELLDNENNNNNNDKNGDDDNNIQSNNNNNNNNNSNNESLETERYDTVVMSLELVVEIMKMSTKYIRFFWSSLLVVCVLHLLHYSLFIGGAAVAQMAYTLNLIGISLNIVWASLCQ